MTDIINTGERILLEKESPLMIARHFCAYRFAKAFVAGNRVLDIGCGEGYGSDFLAGCAEEVLAIDYDASVIDYAKDKYCKDNLSFIVMDIKDLRELTGKFNVICSFQNIEHIKDTDRLLRDISGLLGDKGVFVCSTCNMKDASPGKSTPFNKFHVREYFIHEFESMFKQYFGSVELCGLKRGLALRVNRRLKKAGIFNFLPAKIDPVKRFYSKISCKYFKWVKEDLDNCLDFIAVCRK